MATKTITSKTKILSRVNITQIEDEIILFLRSNITDRRNRTKNASETFTGDGETLLFELQNDTDNKGRHKVMNIRSLEVDNIPQKLYTDYTCGFKLRNFNLTHLNENLGKLQFWNPVADGKEIKVNYDYGYTFVYPNNNRVDLTTVDYPRILVDVTDDMEDLGIGGCGMIHNLTVTIVVTDTLIEGVRATIQEIKDKFLNLDVKKEFYSFTYIMLSQIQPGPQVSAEDTNDVLYEQVMTFLIPHQFEFSK